MINNAFAHDLLKVAFEKEAEEIKEAGIASAHPVLKGVGIASVAGILYGLGSQHATSKAYRRQLEYYNKLKPRNM